MLKRKLVRVLFFALFLPLVNPAIADSTNAGAVQKTMAQAIKSLSYLIDVALDPDFDRTDDEDFILNLELMQRLSGKIAAHTQGMTSALNLVTLSLDDTIDQMVANYKSGYDTTGELYLVETVDHCVACLTGHQNWKVISTSMSWSN